MTTKNARHGTRTCLVATATVAVALFLAGCSTVTPPLAAPPDPVVEHIHELVVDPSDGTLLVATHQGLYRITVGSDEASRVDGPVGGLDFDPMGFTIADGVAYASGHPGPTTPDSFGSPNLGLITSTDAGGTWSNVSLTGVTDFHALTVKAGDNQTPVVFGYDGSAGRLERSIDGGLTWSSGAQVDARDILAVGDELYATTAEGLAVSTDSGATFAVDPAAPSLVVIAADQEGSIAGVDASGTIWTRQPGQAWTHHHTVTGTPQALAVDGSQIYVADDRGIAVTEDAGGTWKMLTVES